MGCIVASNVHGNENFVLASGIIVVLVPVVVLGFWISRTSMRTTTSTMCRISTVTVLGFLKQTVLPHPAFAANRSTSNPGSPVRSGDDQDL